jgi:beta-glucosidase-like glycosyl hydrolase
VRRAAASLTLGLVFAPRVTRTVATIFAAEAIADGLHMTHAAVWERQP